METEYTLNDSKASDIYRFRYRAMNVNGWSDFSPISHIKAATTPQRPPKPEFVDATSTTLTLSLQESTVDGGEVITEYELYVNAGGSSVDFTKVLEYDGQSRLHTITDDLLTAGVVYKFKIRAVNAYGNSEYSEELDAAIASFPLANDSLSKLTTTETSITLQWTASADTELPVIGYVFNQIEFGSDHFSEVVTLFPNLRTYTVSNLETGLAYGFTIQALNFNG
jgi:uncharacterized protein